MRGETEHLMANYMSTRQVIDYLRRLRLDPTLPIRSKQGVNINLLLTTAVDRLEWLYAKYEEAELNADLD